MLDDSLKRMKYLMGIKKGQPYKLIKESTDLLIESRTTVNMATSILIKNGIDSSKIDGIINDFKHMGVNEILFPIMAYAFIENKSTTGLKRVFTLVDEMMKDHRVYETPQFINGRYFVNKKYFNTFQDFGNYIINIHKVEKEYGEWSSEQKTHVDTDPIWPTNGVEGNGIRIYDGNDVGRCIKYTQGDLTGHVYSFCIGQPQNSNWQSYRTNDVSTFYYVVDDNRDFNDPLHIVVVDHDRDKIKLTDSSNTTGNIAIFGRDTEKQEALAKWI